MSPRRQVLLTLALLAFMAVGAISAATTGDDYTAALIWIGVTFGFVLALIAFLVWLARPLTDDEICEQQLDDQLARHRAYPRRCELDQETTSA